MKINLSICAYRQNKTFRRYIDTIARDFNLCLEILFQDSVDHRGAKTANGNKCLNKICIAVMRLHYYLTILVHERLNRHTVKI